MVEKGEADLTQLFRDHSFSLSQKLWYGYGGVPLFSENMELLTRQLEALKIPLPGEFINKRELFRLVKRMLNKNKFYRSGLVNIQLFWKDREVQTLVTCNAYAGFDFPFSEEGLLVCFSSQKKFAGNRFNRFVFFNETLWETALAEIRDTPFQQVFILNEKNNICESAYANIFMVKGGELFTPSLKSGSYEDVVRPVVLEMANHLGLKTSETEILREGDVLEMDEVFIASEQLGIKWILGVENKRYLHYYSEKIHKKMGEFLKGKVR